MSKILFIEDEIALQTTLTTVLKEKGYEVGNAHDGEAGLKMAQEIKPDLILLDLILPKIDGFTVYFFNFFPAQLNRFKSPGHELITTTFQRLSNIIACRAAVSRVDLITGIACGVMTGRQVDRHGGVKC